MKGLTTLIEALNLIAEKGFSDSFELVLVGHGQVPDFLDTRIKFENFLSGNDEETAKILGTCQILALPSIQDNLPSTMTEALCAGLSVVGTKTGGIDEILTAYNQVSVEPEDPHGFAEALLSLRHHRIAPSKSQALSEFSYAAVAVRLLLIYKGE
jgi:glycosyltransferase involved in cell wall biosynthesis